MSTESLFQSIAILTFLTGISLSIYFRRQAETKEKISSKGEGPLVGVLLRLFGLPLFIGTMLYLIHPPWMAWSTLSLPIGLRWLGVGLGLGTLPLLWWTFKSLGTNITRTVALRSQHRLVTHGPYGWVRHPLYSSACVSWCGFSLLSQSWFIALTSVLTVAVLVVRTRTEEENLIERFGDEYRDYMNRTGRFLPGL